MASVSAELKREQRNYGEVVRWDPEQEVYRSEGVRLLSFSSPEPFRDWWVNRAIRLGVANPLRENLSGMRITEEQIREQMIADGRLSPDDERKVLVVG